MSGIIATNTTFSRDGLAERIDETGGLSGKPLHERSLAMVKYIYKHTEGALPIVGLGGVSSAADVVAFLRAGASLVQLYTGLIYEGPFLVKRMKRELAEYCVAEGVSAVHELTGTANELGQG